MPSYHGTQPDAPAIDPTRVASHRRERAYKDAARHLERAARMEGYARAFPTERAGYEADARSARTDAFLAMREGGILPTGTLPDPTGTVPAPDPTGT